MGRTSSKPTRPQSLYSLDELMGLGIDLEIDVDRQTCIRDIRFLGTEVVKDLLEIKKKDKNDYQKLRKSISRATIIPTIFSDRERFVKGDSESTKDIIEIKAKDGKARVMAFLDGNSLIVIAHTYWKTTGKRASQSLAFGKAATIRALYFKEKEASE